MGYQFEDVLLERYALHPGDYEVKVDASRYSSTTARVVVRSGLESIAPVELAQSIHVMLRFHAEAGDPPLASVDLVVRNHGQSQVLEQHRAGADGALTLALDLDPGAYRITATASDGRLRHLSLGSGGNPT